MGCRVNEMNLTRPRDVRRLPKWFKKGVRILYSGKIRFGDFRGEHTPLIRRHSLQLMETRA